MRDFRDAKTMAQTLRETLEARQVSLTHSESLELVARMFGVGEWNRLAAAISGEERGNRAKRSPRRKLPALPIRDAVPFPGTEMPFWLRRPESIRALESAHAAGRQIVLVAQRTAEVDQPGLADVYEVGVTGRVLDIGPPTESVIARMPHAEGSTQILIQTHQRVFIRAFTADRAGYEVEIEDVDEGPMREDPELVRQAVEGFEKYTSARQAGGRRWPPVEQLHDPGRVADVIAQALALPVEDKQSLLATVDPAERPQAVMRHLPA